MSEFKSAPPHSPRATTRDEQRPLGSLRNATLTQRLMHAAFVILAITGILSFVFGRLGRYLALLIPGMAGIVHGLFVISFTIFVILLGPFAVASVLLFHRDMRKRRRFDKSVNQGLTCAKKKYYGKAIAEFTAAINHDPTNANVRHVFYNRGVAYNELKDYDNAILDFNEAIRLDPVNADAFHGRGFAYDKKEDYEEAIANYSEAMRFDPERFTFLKTTIESIKAVLKHPK